MSKTIEKGLQLLDLFSDEKPSWRLEEISTYTKIPKATALRILRSFVDYGYLQRTVVERSGVLIEGDCYSLGMKLLQLGERVANGLEIRQIALPYMKLLQGEFNEAVQLVAREKLEGVYIEKVESTRPVRLYTRVGRMAPLYAGACTRMLLSFLPDEEINEILRLPMIEFASNTPKTREEVWRYIEETRKYGFTYSISELEEGTVSIAVPIFNHKGDAEFSISIAGFATSLPKEDIEIYIEPLWRIASQISKNIGFSRPYPYGPYTIQESNRGMAK